MQEINGIFWKLQSVQENCNNFQSGSWDLTIDQIVLLCSVLVNSSFVLGWHEFEIVYTADFSIPLKFTVNWEN